MDGYRIPKFQVEAEARLHGHPPSRVRLHLAARSARRPGPETVEDLLEGTKAFLPVTCDDGRVAFLAREALLWLAVAGMDEDEPAEARTAVEVVLLDGTHLGGQVRYLLPPERGRLQDHLNVEERFLALRDGDRTYYVNRRRIAWVRMADEEMEDDAED